MSRTGNPSTLEALATIPRSGPDCCILEILGEPAGLLITEKHGLVFYAASKKTWPLDRRVFSRRQDAERAIRALLSLGRSKSQGSQPPVDR